MAVFLWHWALAVSVALGCYWALAGAPAPLPASPVLLAIAAGYAAGALAYLFRRLVLRAFRLRDERRIRRSWWTPEQFAR